MSTQRLANFFNGIQLNRNIPVMISTFHNGQWVDTPEAINTDATKAYPLIESFDSAVGGKIATATGKGRISFTPNQILTALAVLDTSGSEKIRYIAKAEDGSEIHTSRTINDDTLIIRTKDVSDKTTFNKRRYTLSLKETIATHEFLTTMLMNELTDEEAAVSLQDVMTELLQTQVVANTFMKLADGVTEGQGTTTDILPLTASLLIISQANLSN